MILKKKNKQHQRVLCNVIRRLPNETIKQLAVRIETLVRKAYSLKTHDYKNTKMTDIMTLTSQLREIAIKKRASHPSSTREPDLDFRKLVDKLEQAEIAMKIEETENLKLQYVNRIETNTTHINNIQGSDTDLIEKIIEILNIYEKNPNFKGKQFFNKWCNYCRQYGHSIAECRQKQQDNQNKPQKHKEPNNSFISIYEKRSKPTKPKTYIVIIFQENHFQTTQIIQEINHHITLVIEVDRPNKEIHEISHKIDIVDRIAKITKIEITIHDRIQTQQNLFLHPVPIQTQGIDTIPIIDHETHHTTEIETIQTIEIEVILTIEIRTIQTTDQGIIHLIDQIIKDQMITIITDHEIIHKIESQVTTIDTEIIPSHPIGIITVTPILNIDTEVTHQSIKDTSIKCK